MSKKNTILTMIDKMVEEKTFSGDAIASIAELRKHAQDMEDRLAEQVEENKELSKESNLWEKKYEECYAACKDAVAHNEELEKEVATTRELETAKQVAIAQSNTIKECFGLVFRNATVQRSVFGSMPVVPNVSDNGMQGYPQQENFNQTTTEEQV